MIKKIELFKQSMHSNDHMVIATPVNYNPKKQRVLISVNNKVAEAIYNPETKNVTALLDAPPANANHLLASQLPQNAAMRVKVFVYDFIEDKILGAKLQDFEYNTPTLSYKVSDELLSTSTVIIGDWDKKGLVDRAMREEKIKKPRQIVKLEVSNGKSIDGFKKEFVVDIYLNNVDLKNTNLLNTQSIEIEIDSKKFKATVVPKEPNHWRAIVNVVFYTINLLKNNYILTTNIVSTYNFTQESYIISSKAIMLEILSDGIVNKIAEENDSEDLEKSDGNNCEQKFKKIAPIILNHEGGYKNEPLKDKGDPTNKGISWPIWKKYAKKDLNVEPTEENQKKLTDAQATIIYRKYYWEPKGYCQLNNLKIALMIYDWTITSGGAIKEIQKLLKNFYDKEIVIDGAMGLQTVKVINSIDDVEELLNKIAEIRIVYYQKGANEGWFSTDYSKGLKDRVTKCLNYVL